MTMQQATVLLWVAAAAGLGATVLRVRGALPRDPDVTQVRLPEPSVSPVYDSEVLGAGATRAAGTALFGDTEETDLAPDDERVNVEPRLDVQVVGILGPPWTGVLRGFPGRGGALVVRPGDVLGSLRVVSISEENVVLSWGDSTLTLAPRWEER